MIEFIVKNDVPDFLFRYFHLEGRRSNGRPFLEQGWLVFGDPNSFNDPFDGLPRYDQAAEKYTPQILPPGAGHSPALVDEFQNFGYHQMPSLLKKRRNESRRVSCFSKNGKNVLMWAHYSRSHSGFAVEFNTKDELFRQGMVEIDYSDFRPIYNPSDSSEVDRTKSCDWRYEQEWRLYRQKSDLKVHSVLGFHYFELRPESIKRILIGWKCKDKHLKLFRDFRSRFPDVQLVKMRPEKDSFLVEEDPSARI